MISARPSISIALALALCTTGCAHNAQSSGKERPTYSLSKKVLEDFGEFGERMKKKDWEGAAHKLDVMEKRSNLNPYEQASIWAARAGVFAAKNELDKSVEAL